MATGKALVCRLGAHIPIEGADRIVQVDMFGETIITQKDTPEGTVGLLFDMETCLSYEYASKNNMFRNSSLNEDKKVVGYLEDNKRIRAVKLKGVKCSALFMPITSLSFHTDVRESNMGYSNIVLGQEIDNVLGVKICEKYVSQATKQAGLSNKEGKAKFNAVPTFKEHIDTDQWSRNKHKVKEGNLVIITEKLHGTSGRCGYLPVIKKKNWNLWQKLVTSVMWFLIDFRRYNPFKEMTPDIDYEFIVGSRRVVKSIGGNEAENKAHYYEDDLWTKISKEHFEGKLNKGETIYFEIVGYTTWGQLIMPQVSNKKLEKFLSKSEYTKFIESYGETTRFDYGCTSFIISNDFERRYKVFVYRITTTNEDGDSVDYSWDQVKNRCERMGVNHVPELAKFVFSEGYVSFEETVVEKLVTDLTNAKSNTFPGHVREGVCIRIEDGGVTPILLKEKSFIFKVLEGIVKDNDVVDLEESN